MIRNHFDFPNRQFKLIDKQHTLQCFAEGFPRPRVSWYHSGKKLVPTIYYNITTEKIKRISTGTIEVRVKLTFLVWISGVYEGTYECRASNSFGSTQQSTVLESSKLHHIFSLRFLMLFLSYCVHVLQVINQTTCQQKI